MVRRYEGKVECQKKPRLHECNYSECTCISTCPKIARSEFRILRFLGLVKSLPSTTTDRRPVDFLACSIPNMVVKEGLSSMTAIRARSSRVYSARLSVCEITVPQTCWDVVMYCCHPQCRPFSGIFTRPSAPFATQIWLSTSLIHKK